MLLESSFIFYVGGVLPSQTKFIATSGLATCQGDLQQILKSIFNYWWKNVSFSVFLGLPGTLYKCLFKTLAREPERSSTFWSGENKKEHPKRKANMTPV